MSSSRTISPDTDKGTAQRTWPSFDASLSQRSYIHSCERFAAWLKRSPDTATPDKVGRFQLHL
jgi:hypothetical protein